MAAVLALNLLIQQQKIIEENKSLHALKQAAMKKRKIMIPETQTDLEGKCRICLQEADIPIFTTNLIASKAEYIKRITDVEVKEDDELPNVLCRQCDVLVQNVIILRQTALKIDARLKQQVAMWKENEERKRKNPKVTKHKRIKVLKYDEDSKYDDMMLDDPDYSPDLAGSDDNEHDDGDNNTNDADVVETIEYRCEKCPIRFSSLEQYITHMRTTHEPWKVPCPQCDGLFVRSYLERHLASVHRNEKPFVCEFCGIGFPYKMTLQCHLRIHTDEFPYKCDQCPYRGRIRENLKSHLRTHSGEKPYPCEICGARFQNTSNYKRHKLQHRTDYDFKCDKCNKGFHLLSKLKTHVRVTHDGVKEHECDICNKTFGYRKRMMQHKRKIHKTAKMPTGRMPSYLLVERKRQQELVTT